MALWSIHGPLWSVETLYTSLTILRCSTSMCISRSACLMLGCGCFPFTALATRTPLPSFLDPPHRLAK